ncbi:MAG: hypothetical protein E6K18_08835 [Methanobacteriota archaeon]|nr:MAG: hypothetical protein E6K18_08835 [Euryarchaeota archaeon]
MNAAPPPVSDVRTVPDFQERMTLFKSMFESGKMSHTMYEVNVARALEGEEPRLAQLRTAHEAGRIPRAVYETNVRRLLREHEVG